MLYDAAEGDPSASDRWRAIHSMGGDQEVLVALRTRAGHVWGGLALYRATGSSRFTEDEVAFLQAIAPALGEGARRGLLLGEARDPEGPDAPAVVVVSGAGGVESATPGAERWLDQLPGGDWAAGRLPTAVHSIAARALGAPVESASGDEVAVARVMTAAGAWVLLHGAALLGGGPRRAAVIVERAQPARIAPLLMNAYGLTEREQEVTRLVLQGQPTAAIAERLSISPFTVQEHLKKIFEKTGVRSRRDLVANVFFAHYEPRLRDNEERTAGRRPLLGGPFRTVTHTAGPARPNRQEQ